MKSVTKNTFDQDVIKSDKIVLLDAWAPWCGPCRAMMPLLEILNDEIDDDTEIVKVDVSEEMDLAQQLGVTGIPNFFVFKNGQVVANHVGMASKDTLKELIEKAKK